MWVTSASPVQGSQAQRNNSLCLGNKLQIPQRGTQSCAVQFLITSERTICSGPVVFKLFGLRVPLKVKKKNFIGVDLQCCTVSGIQQSEPVIYMYISSLI